MNGSMYIGDTKEDVDEQMNVASELLVDRTANGMFEIIRRNPEVMKWLQRWYNLTPEQEQIAQAEANALEMAYTSLVDFRKLYLPSPDDCAPADFHKEWSDILLYGKKHFATEAFRESGKSVLVIRAHSLYRLVFPSEEYNFIVIIMANQTLASARLKDLADDYITDPKLSANLVDIKKNNDKTFEVIVKDIYGKEINVRIDAYGKGSSVRGLLHGETRPKLIIIDDPQDLEDMGSQTVLEKDYNWFLSDIVFLGKRSRIFMIGNNLGESCLIERVLANKKYLGFDTSRIPILKEGKSTWAGKYTEEFIDRER